MSDTPAIRRGTIWAERLAKYQKRLGRPSPLVVEGRLTRIVGLTLEAVGVQEAIGGRCLVVSPGSEPVEAEVVGFAEGKTYLMPTGETVGLQPNARVIPTHKGCEVKVGYGLLGRVLDGAGNPLDGKGPLDVHDSRSITGQAFNPLVRRPIDLPLDVGIGTINALLTVGRGQRMGLFAGTGVGKSVLLGMMTKYTTADVIVVGLVGERGREVKEFVERILGEEGLRRAVVVATPADNPPLLRLHGAMLATSIAEYFRDEGKEVLLLMDSLTRFAQAQREIALAVGEPPATKGYPPSVFAKLPRLVERAGNGAVGSITAFYTVLTEGDDTNDPVADAARGILDGHVVLSRELAEMGHYPAIDVEASVSRVMVEITTPEHQAAVRRFRQLYSTYRQNRDLISVGAYQQGNDPRIDEAIRYHQHLVAFMQQDIRTARSFESSVRELTGVLAPPPA